MMSFKLEPLNLLKFKSSEISKSDQKSIIGGVVAPPLDGGGTEGGIKLDSNKNGFSWESDYVYGNITTYTSSGFHWITNGVISSLPLGL